MQTRITLALAVACSCAFGAFAQDNCITIPAGEFRLVPWPCAPNTPQVLVGPPTSYVGVLSWNGSSFDENQYYPHTFDSPPMICGVAVVFHPVGGPVTICYPQTSQATTPPLPLACGLNLVGCQSNTVAGFQEIVGRAPWEGVQLFRLNPGLERNVANFGSPDYTVYTFSAGAWSPSVPVADLGEAVFVYQPPPKLWKFQVTNGQVRFEVTAPPGKTVTVEYCDELSSGAGTVVWNQVTTFTGDGSFQRVTDQPASGTTSQRFYRVRIPR